jgi:hypothetical protein
MSKLAPSKTSIAIPIITDIERYRSLLTVMKENGDLNFLQ